ncbi:MAG: hypothetical protein IJA72_03395 [Clostridia bacterium]|nr:hypothetical protein [Clostridia bacterium]
MDNTKTQDKQTKLLTILELLNGVREKLYATYNLFVANVEQTKTIKEFIALKYEQLLDKRNEFVQLTSSNKPAKMRVAKLRKEASVLKDEHDAQVAMVGDGMADAEACRKTYKHEVALCCDTYKKLGAIETNSEDNAEQTVPASTEKGYKQQVKLIRRILDKIDEVKVSFKNVKADIKERVKLFNELFAQLEEQTLALSK